jgi:hypothetical protein
MRFKQFISLNKVLFCLILFFLGLMSASVTHTENYRFVVKLGSEFRDVNFNYPCAVAVDSSGAAPLTVHFTDKSIGTLTSWKCVLATEPIQ